MITSEIKDRVLKYLIENADDCSIDIYTRDLAQKLEIGVTALGVILGEFVDKFMIKTIEMSSVGHYHLTMMGAAYELYNSGGYKFREEVAGLELLKLKREIELLQESIPKAKYDILMTAISTVISAIGLQVRG